MDMHHLKSHTQPVLTQVLTLTEMSSETIHTANLYTSLTLRHVTTWNHTHTQSLHTSSYPQIHYCLKSHIQPIPTEQQKKDGKAEQRAGRQRSMMNILAVQAMPASNKGEVTVPEPESESLFDFRFLALSLTPFFLPFTTSSSSELKHRNYKLYVTVSMCLHVYVWAGVYVCMFVLLNL